MDMDGLQTIEAPLAPPVSDLDPYAIDTLLSPGRFQTALRDTGPVVYLARYGVYAVGRYREAAHVLSDWAHFSNAAGIGIQDIRKPGENFRIPSVLLEVDPPAHEAVRRPLAKFLSPQRMKAWRAEFKVAAEALVAELIDRRDVDGVEDVAEAFIFRVFPHAVGVKIPRTETLAIGNMRFNQSGPPNELYHRAMVEAEPYLDWFESSIQRDAVAAGSISEQLYEAEQRGEFLEGTASNLVRSFVGGGTDSTISGIGATLCALARNPDQWAKVRENPARVRAAFEEGIRLDSPFQVTFRTTVEDVVLSGHRIPAQSKVGVFLGAANRDPAEFQDPDMFEISRPAKALAFGNGVHLCVGQVIAKLEADALLTALAERVVSLELTGEPRYRPVNQVRTLDHLPLRLNVK
jgi:cytochrome P450